jgi:hypothetical protein
MTISIAPILSERFSDPSPTSLVGEGIKRERRNRERRREGW